MASSDPNERKRIARKAGKAAHETGTAHEWTSQTAARAGRKGGQKTAQKPGHMAEIGRRGGRARSRKKQGGTDGQD